MKTRISLSRSETLLCALWVAKNPNRLQVDSEDSDQSVPRDTHADLSLWLTHRLFCWFCRAPAQFLFPQDSKGNEEAFEEVGLPPEELTEEERQEELEGMVRCCSFLAHGGLFYSSKSDKSIFDLHVRTDWYTCSFLFYFL